MTTLTNLHSFELPDGWRLSCLYDSNYVGVEKMFRTFDERSVVTHKFQRSSGLTIRVEPKDESDYSFKALNATDRLETMPHKEASAVLSLNATKIAIATSSVTESVLVFSGPSQIGLVCGSWFLGVPVYFVQRWPDKANETQVLIGPDKCSEHSQIPNNWGAKVINRASQIAQKLSGMGFIVSRSDICPVCENGGGEMPKGICVLHHQT